MVSKQGGVSAHSPSRSSYPRNLSHRDPLTHATNPIVTYRIRTDHISICTCLDMHMPRYSWTLRSPDAQYLSRIRIQSHQDTVASCSCLSGIWSQEDQVPVGYSKRGSECGKEGPVPPSARHRWGWFHGGRNRSGPSCQHCDKNHEPDTDLPMACGCWGTIPRRMIGSPDRGVVPQE